MALIVETGSIVASANSYVSVADARAFALLRGVALPVDDSAVETLAIKAMDWLESLSSRYQGTLVDADQELQWPRKDVVLNGFDFAEDEIPRALQRAQSQVIMDLFAGIDPQANFLAEPAVIKEKVDVLETVYAELTQDSIPYLRKAFDFLEPLFGSTGGGGVFTALRV